MNNQAKGIIIDIISKYVKSFTNEEIQITSSSHFYAIDGITGIKFSACCKTEILFFIGFSSEQKYSDYLLFGVLKSERNGNIKKHWCKYDKNGNLLWEKLKINDKFIEKDLELKNKSLEKWVNSTIESFFTIYNFLNYSYDDVGGFRWFSLVELPYLFLSGSVIYLLYMYNKTKEIFNAPFVCFVASLCFVLFTVEFRLKIRQTLHSIVGINPWTWTVSYIGKLFLSVIFFPIMAIRYVIPFILGFFIPQCNECGAFFYKDLIKREKLGSKQGYKTVTRNDVTRNSNGETLYTTRRKEQIHIIRTYYKDHYRCKHCGFEWTETYSKDKEA